MENRQAWPLEPFNDGVDVQDLGREWEEWKRAFELILELQQFQSQHDKLVFMLARGGRGLQRIYYNLRPVAEEYYPEPVKVPLRPAEIPEYDNAVIRLDKFFVGKRNDRVELELFRSLRQMNDEPFSQFLLKLRAQAARCDFKDREETEILQQISMAAHDERVRDKGLEGVMKLDDLTSYAINRELMVKQKAKSKQFAETNTGLLAAVSQPSARARNGLRPNRSERWGGSNPNRAWRDRRNMWSKFGCENCGFEGHAAGSANCKAKHAVCNRCSDTGHYARKCPNWRSVERNHNQGNIQRMKRPYNVANSLQSSEDWKEELPKVPERKDIAKVE
ncbi:uncharacterized protein LOC129742537 [Uranotaenia lowii]|uniref:uncharacterized protein LOC129742537 n=1 Tax=Uranotaenia lowii TaxID=190385 RepID=UPI002478CB80|nr:uncharacterized protein LOC129742537 [Uranotaenia lowii]